MRFSAFAADGGADGLTIDTIFSAGEEPRAPDGNSLATQGEKTSPDRHFTPLQGAVLAMGDFPPY